MILPSERNLPQPAHFLNTSRTLSSIKPQIRSHTTGMWANHLQPWQGIAYNKNALPNGVGSWVLIASEGVLRRVSPPSTYPMPTAIPQA